MRARVLGELEHKQDISGNELVKKKSNLLEALYLLVMPWNRIRLLQLKIILLVQGYCDVENDDELKTLETTENV